MKTILLINLIIGGMSMFSCQSHISNEDCLENVRINDTLIVEDHMLLAGSENERPVVFSKQINSCTRIKSLFNNLEDFKGFEFDHFSINNETILVELFQRSEGVNSSVCLFISSDSGLNWLKTNVEDINAEAEGFRAVSIDEKGKIWIELFTLEGSSSYYSSDIGSSWISNQD